VPEVSREYPTIPKQKHHGFRMKPDCRKNKAADIPAIEGRTISAKENGPASQKNLAFKPP
jgi:hypothetical protein